MKVLVSTITVLICVLLLVSCKKKHVANSNTTDSNLIVGTWEANSLTLLISYAPFPPYEQDSTFTHGHSIVQIYNADSTAMMINNTVVPADTITGNYYLANDSIYTRQTGDVDYIAEGKYAISNNNQLNITATGDSLGAVITGTLHLTRQ